MLNSGRRGSRSPDGYGILSVNENFNQQNYPIPIINSWSITDGSYNPLSATALSTAGGETVVVYGSGFRSGVTVNINGTNISPVTLLDQGRITFTSPALASASYTMYVSNTNGSTAIYVPGLVYSGVPNWSSPAAGTIGTSYETKAANTLTYSAFTATGDAPVTYSILSGSLPSGVTLSSSGALSGTLPVTSSSTTYSFTIRAYDAQMQTSDRSFSLTINPDAVTWVTPTLNGSYSVYETQAFSTPLSATSAAGYGVMYAANTLPTGISLTSSTGAFTGYANTVGNTYAQLTATANTTGRYATSNVTFTVNQDVVTWSSPANNTNYVVNQGSVMSNVNLTASSAAGYGVQYTANALPTGVSLSGSTISGTPSVAGTTYTQLTATSNTTNRVAYSYISWTVSISGDTYFNNNTLLLSANNQLQTPSFVTDNSLNNAQLTIVGDTKPNNNNPYQSGYYSTQFQVATPSYYNYPASARFDISNTNFTLEFWVNVPSLAAENDIVTYGLASTTTVYQCYVTSSGQIAFNTNATGTWTWGNPYISAAGVITAGKWHHVAVVRNGAGNLNIYVNGINVYTTATYAEPSSYTTGGYFHVGTYFNNANGTGCNGYVSNLRLIKGTALYTTNFTPSTTPLAAVANTVLLTCQSNKIIDNSFYNNTATITGSPVISIAHPFLSEYQANTTYYGVQVNGSGNYVSIPGGNAGFNFGTGDFTIEGWMLVQSGTTFTLFDNRTATTSVNVAVLANAGKIAVYIGGSSFVIAGTVTPTFGTWYHIAAVRISGNLTLYVNGVQSGTTYASSQNITGVTGPVCIGGGYPTGTNSPLTGLISNVRVVKGLGVYTGNFTVPTGPLAATQGASANTSAITTGQTVLLTCQDTKAIDNSSSAQTVSFNGTATPVAISPFTSSGYTNTQITTYGSGYFDGTGDYATIPAGGALMLGSGDFTIEAWVFTTLANQTYGSGIIGTYDGASNGGWSLTINRSTGATYGILFIHANAIQQSYNTYLPVNTWNHIAITRSGSTLKTFLNGIQVATGTYATADTVSATCYIGSQGVGSYHSGYISDVRVVKGTALYTSTFVPQFTSALTSVANTQLLTLQTNGASNTAMFLDQSYFSSNTIINRTGNVTNGTFSPYGDNWSVYVPTGNPVMYSSDSANLVLGTGDWTIEAWINLSTVPGAAQAFYIFSNRRLNNASWTDGPMACITNSKLYARDGNAGFLSATPTTFVAGKWYHVAVCRSGNSIYCFIDGVQEGSAYNISIGGTYAGNSIRVGYEQQFGTTASDGYVSNLRVIKGQALYTANFTPSTTPLLSVANTQFLSCNSNQARDFSINNLTVTKPDSITVQKSSPFNTVTVPKYYSTYFNGSSTTDFLSIPTNTALAMTSADFSAEAWVYFTSLPVNHAESIMNKSGKANVSVPNWDIHSSNGYWGYFIGQSGTSGTAILNIQTTSANILNKWQHVCLIKTGTTYSFYVDGTRVNTATSATVPADNNPLPFTLGYQTDQGATSYLNGYISNARVCKTVLPAGYDATLTSITVPTSPLTATSGTVLLTCQDSTFKDNSTNNFTLTATGSVKPLLVSPFTPTPNTGVTYSPTVFGGSMYFDGTGDYLSTPYNTIHDINTGDFTVEAWVYRNVTGAEHNVFVTRSSAGSDGWNLRINTGNTLQFYFTGGGTQTSTGTIPAGRWTHVAATKSGNTLRLFINGILDGTNAAIGTGTVNAAATLRIGVDNSSAAGYMNGYISDARITKGQALYTSNFYPGATPLTPIAYANGKTDLANTGSAAILLSGTTGGIIDQTRTVDLESLGDTKVVQGMSPYNGNYASYSFDGSINTYLQIPTNSGAMDTPGDFTMELWFFVLVGPTDSNTYGNIYGNNSASNTYMLGLLNSGYTASAPYYIHMLIAADGAKIMSDAPIELGKWYHVAHTRTSGVNRLFVNGVLQTVTFTESVSRSYGSTPTYIAKNLGGYVSNFRFIKGNSLYTTSFTPSTSPLTAVSNTSLLTCQSYQFKDYSTNNLTLTKSGTILTKSQNPFRLNSGQSYYFDGTGDYLTAHTGTGSINFGTGDFTIETWVYFSASNATYNPFIRVNGGSQLDFGFDFSVNQLKYNTSGAVLANSWAPVAGQWYHVALVRSSGVAKIYVDGTNISGSGTVDSFNHSLNSYSTFYRIGGSDFSASHVMYGYLSDFRITKGVARYTTTFTPPTTALILK